MWCHITFRFLVIPKSKNTYLKKNDIISKDCLKAGKALPKTLELMFPYAGTFKQPKTIQRSS